MKTKKCKMRYVWSLGVCALLGLIFIFSFSANHFTSYAAESEPIVGEKVYCEATIEDDFAENRLLVVMKQQEGNYKTNYTLSDFPEIDAVEIEDLSQSAKAAYFNNVETSANDESAVAFHYCPRTILCIKLREAGKRKVLKAVKALERREDVESAEPDFALLPEQAPNDPYYEDGEQWGLNGRYGIKASDAWDMTVGSFDVQVGVIDTGIDATHEDLQNRVNTSLSRNFASGSDSGALVDTNSHGTHVAGIIGAQGNNDIGITGVNWNVQLISLKIDDGSLSQDTFNSRLIAAVEYATSVGIPVLNNSNGYNNYTGTSSALEAALMDYPGLFVTSAGNIGNNNDANEQRFPSNIDLPNVISVGALNAVGGKSSYSNYGENTVAIYAPGDDIYSTVPTSYNSMGYATKSGTSMAAPHVTGVAALMLSLKPTMTGAELKNVILQSADSITIHTPDDIQTVKKLNAYQAVNALWDYTNLFAGGTGSPIDPFLVNNETEFRNIGIAYRAVYQPYEGNVDRIDYSFKLTNNIEISGDWVPFQYHFTGELDGDGHYITYNMTLTQSKLDTYSRHWGLFGFVVGSGMFTNLELRNCTITGDVDTELSYTGTSSTMRPDIGILAGSIYQAGSLNSVKITNPTIRCNVTDAIIGGIAGSITATHVNNCEVTGGTLTSYSGALGGMAGYGDIDYFSGGVCSTTLHKYHYALNDQVGKVLGNTQETSNVNVTGATIETHKDGGCVAAGTLITLADGSRVPVEELTGNELLLVWNLETGSFDAAPILFIDSEPEEICEIINLSFSDGTSVKVIYEHGFWDCNLNQYVYLGKDAAQYLGHWFNKQTTDESGSTVSAAVQLTGVTITYETTVAYSPVTYGHLCYYVNGLLSMPGGIEGLFNIFEVNGETMRYDEAQKQTDIAEYGLYTYEEFAAQFGISEEAFEAVNGQYLKIEMGKGLIDADTIQSLIARYGVYFE